MDDLIVIILTLVIAGIGGLAQLKKRKLQAGSRGQPEKARGFWDLVEGKIDSVNQDTDYEVDEKDRQISIVPEEIPSYKTKANIQNRLITADVFVKEIKKSKLKSKLKEDFSLRKAVIYSEILNRKYI